MGDSAVPADGDVHLRIWLGAIAFDYRASAAAAYHLMRDRQRRHWCVVERIVHSAGERLPETRLPNERLFLGP